MKRNSHKYRPYNYNSDCVTQPLSEFAILCHCLFVILVKSQVNQMVEN